MPGEENGPDVQQHRGSCDPTLSKRGYDPPRDSVRPVDPLLLITNQDAGTADEENLERALEVLRSATDVEVCATSNPGELDGVLHRRGSRPVVVAGGDGSLHAIVSALYRRHELAETVVGLIPLGTGNDFARGTGIPLEPDEAAHVILTGETRTVDLVVDELGEVVVNNVHAGAGAQASRRAARWKDRLGKVGLGRLGYPVGAALAAVKPPFVRLEIEIDGEIVADFDKPILMVAVGNGAFVGGGTELTPTPTRTTGRST